MPKEIKKNILAVKSELASCPEICVMRIEGKNTSVRDSLKKERKKKFSFTTSISFYFIKHRTAATVKRNIV